jgi:Ran GTPase-activating protein (RanGAP) involved in mRNA processing and transport
MEFASCLPDSTLESFNIQRNNIGEEGSDAIASKLPKSSLQFLNMANNKLSDKCTIAIAAALSHKTRLEILDLSSNAIWIEGSIMQLVTAARNSNIKRLPVRYHKMPSCFAKHF